MKVFILFSCFIFSIHVSIAQCASAGEDSLVEVCRNEPFIVNTFLSDSAATNGSWFNPSGNPIVGVNSFSINIPGQYVYTYVVQDSVCGTIDSAIFIINVLAWCATGGIEETNSSNLTIFPNPTSNGVFTLSKKVDYVIEDATGQRIPFIHSPGLFFIVVGETRYKLINL
ncbi:MAG: hypothetical protein RIT10_904 [Bacteroidota bacterium]|jgi:hypothetical protein